MKSIKPAFPVVAAIISLLSLFSATSQAAPDAARVVGDLRVDGLVLNLDNSTVIRKLTDLSSPWSIANTDITFMSQNGRVGIGVLKPLVALDVFGDTQLTGNLLLPTTTATTGIIKSGSYSLLHTYDPSGTNSNLFVGIQAGNFTLTKNGKYNTAIGSGSLQAVTDGVYNTAVGADSLNKNTQGGNNTAIGYGSLASNLTGVTNTATGMWALLNNSQGSNNTATGEGSLYSNTIGGSNTAFGLYSLFGNISGNYNTSVGMYAGYTAVPANANTSGNSNTFIGYNSGPGSPAQLTNATAIGADALVNQDNSLVLGKPGVKVGIGTMAPDSAFYVTTATSSPVRIGDTGCISPTATYAGIGLFGAMSGCLNYAILGENGTMPNLYLNRPPGGDIKFHMNNVPQMVLDHFGGLILDAGDANGGVFNHTSTGGAGLAFGVNSGEGIASKRTAGGNQWGLDFYTFSTPRLSIAYAGNVGIGTTAPSPSAALDVVGTVKATQFTGSGAGLTGIWKANGNALTTPGTDFIGTTDTKALEIKVNNQRALRIEPNPSSGVPNIVSGHASNASGLAGNVGATISGGGSASGPNIASASFSTIGGGWANTASGQNSTIVGGEFNTASGVSSTISGGSTNIASGNYSWAGGRQAHTNSDVSVIPHNGAFIWADSAANAPLLAGQDFFTLADDEFAVRARGGVRFVTAVNVSGVPTKTTTIDSNGNILIPGNVGVGTKTPNRPLHIVGSSSADMSLQATSGLANWRTWNMIVNGTPGASQNLTFRILNDAGTTAMLNPLVLWNDGTASFASSITASAYNVPSDLRLKTDIQPLENTLDKVLRVRGVSYVMKADETKTRKIGVIAQELEQEYPELVATDDKGMKSVSYANLTPVLIEAVKALKAENDALKADLAEIKRMLMSNKP